VVDAVNKHNERNPAQVVLTSTPAPSIRRSPTTGAASWHFRFDADADMKMAALTDAIAQNGNARKVYLIKQDYAFGQASQGRRRRCFPQKAAGHSDRWRWLHPLGKIKDFSPYVAKIKASGAQTPVITGNWGQK